jgi:3-hydroxyacyl-CoA dehydrogenase
MTKERYEKSLALVTGTLGYEKFKDVDLVIEASLFPYWWARITQDS